MPTQHLHGSPTTHTPVLTPETGISHRLTSPALYSTTIVTKFSVKQGPGLLRGPTSRKGYPQVMWIIKPLLLHVLVTCQLHVYAGSLLPPCANSLAFTAKPPRQLTAPSIPVSSSSSFFFFSCLLNIRKRFVSWVFSYLSLPLPRSVRHTLE